MNIYIDFDSTLFNTSMLKKSMLNSIAKDCSEINKELLFENIFDEANSLFNKNNIYDIFKLCGYFALKYSIEESILKNNIESIIFAGDNFVYNDSIEFLKKIKMNNKLILLTYSDINSIEFQMKKILGSKLTPYFDSVFITSSNKGSLGLDYENSIFVDDNPNVICDICDAGATNVFRIRRKDNKYSSMDITKYKIKEYNTLKDLKF